MLVSQRDIVDLPLPFGPVMRTTLGSTDVIDLVVKRDSVT